MTPGPMGEVERRVRERFREAFGLTEASVDHLVATSRKALAQGLERLAEACAAGDRAGLSHWAHSLRGSLLNAGLDEAAAEARRIETLSASEPLEPLALRVEALRADLADFLGAS